MRYKADMELSWTIAINFFFIYFIVWWMVLLCVLPVGVKQTEAVGQGNDAGAPKNPVIKKRLIWTSSITFFITVATVYAIEAGVMEFFKYR